jgi:hypothetical protein
LDPYAFAARYAAYSNGNPSALGPAGVLIGAMLVIWAASFGFDESGVVNPANSYEIFRHRRFLCDKWIRESLEYLDEHSILRKPSFDGVRALLLLLPLAKGEDGLAWPFLFHMYG